MNRRQLGGVLILVSTVIAGTVLDSRARQRGVGGSQQFLVADLHVHPYPGDGSLTVWQLQREAARRGVDVIAITSHNHRIGLALSGLFGTDPDGALLLPGQEVTAADYHMIAAGIRELIDWRLPAAEAVAAVHRQGGVAIAAHPVDAINSGWEVTARRTLDGSEIMHPLRFNHDQEASELDAFFHATRDVNPSLAAIGSTDFHMTAPLGLCRTYVLTRERTVAAVLEAIRDGRTAAACGDGEPVGEPEHVAAVRDATGSIARGTPPGRSEKLLALTALIALAALALPARK